VVLWLKQNCHLCRINIQVKRLGGGFGGKLTRSTQIAAACAISAHTIGKPVRIELDLETNLSLVGRRPPYVITYEVRQKIRSFVII